MATFVVDASATLAWCFEDEATAWTDGLLDRLRAGDQIVVPAHWPTEISNGLLTALRRQRIPPDRPELFWDELANLPIEVEPPLSPDRAKAVLSLSRQFGLTVYDAIWSWQSAGVFLSPPWIRRWHQPLYRQVLA
ncbi:MAG: type II toxin-antitoxin system VapC family toxin [Acidobacteriaceae bacterium]